MATRISLPTTLLWAALCFGPLATLSAQEFEDVTTVVAIEIPVQVIKDGKPVRGLTADDFEILEGRKQHEIVAFEAIDLSPTTRTSESAPDVIDKPVPISARRHFLLLFDLSFSDPKSVTVARRAARDLIEVQGHSQDLIAVGTYSSSRGFNLVLGFTSDRGQVEFALDNLGLAEPLHRVEDPLGLLIADLSSGGGTGGGAGNRADDVVANFRDMQIQTRRNERSQKENQVLALLSSLESAGTLLRSVPGRVQVVLLSEGFETSVILGAEGTTQEEQERMSEMARNVAFGESFRVDQDERFGSTRALSALERMLSEFRRADAAIYTIDIGGLQAGGDVESRTSSTRPDRSNGLFIMAHETGGDFYRNTNDLEVAMEEMVEQTSVTYLLVFQPPDIELDGSYHRLKVRLKNDSRGTRLVHREGYYAPLPYNQQTPEARQLATAGLLMGGDESGSITPSVLALPIRDGAGKPYVPVLIEIDGEALLASPSKDYSQVEIYVYALDKNGSIQDFFTERVGLVLSDAADKLRESGFKYWGELDLEPGDYLLRVLVRNGMTGDSGLRVVTLTVPDLEQAGAFLLPPLFPEPMDKWLVAREEVSTERRGAFPFVLQGKAFFPAGRPDIADNKIATVCLMDYGLSDRSLELSGRFLTSDSSPVPDVDVWVHWLPDPKYQGTGCMPATIQAVGMPPGEYILEVTAKEPATGNSWSTTTPITVPG